MCAVLWTGCRKPPATSKSSEAGRADFHALAVPEQGAYTGAYIDFGDLEDNVTLEGIEGFEAQAGKHQAIIAFSSFWGEGSFPLRQVNIIKAHGSAPLIFWSPWDYPYKETMGPDKFRLDSIVAGQWDGYIDQWADAAKATRQPLFVSLCNEMNGDWFPWSACYYGGSKVIPGTNPPKYEGPEFCKRAYRYIVDRVRARGAKNVLWVFHMNNFSEPYEPWNGFKEYYPGPDYVDWMGLSVYGEMFPHAKWDEFEDMIDKPYMELAAVDATKPMMLTEWGCGEFPYSGNKADWISEGYESIRKNYPRIRAAVYWNERWQNSPSQLYSNLRINSSPESLEAYRKGVASAYWLGCPLYR